MKDALIISTFICILFYIVLTIAVQTSKYFGELAGFMSAIFTIVFIISLLLKDNSEQAP